MQFGMALSNEFSTQLFISRQSENILIYVILYVQPRLMIGEKAHVDELLVDWST